MEDGIYNAHEETSKKMDMENPTGFGVFSLNRKEGSKTGQYSSAEGQDTTASGEASHAEGYDTVASDVCSHAEGNQTTASGRNSHAEGYCTVASGMSAHAEGDGNGATGDYSHAEGIDVEASGNASHAEGYNTAASNEACHAEGYDTVADDTACHAEGYGSKATVRYSHAEGWNTEAKGEASHVEGLGTIASKSAQHVQGKYNVEDTEGIYTHIVGGGTSRSDRKNIHTLDLQGNAVFAGDVTNGNGVSMDGLKELVESVQNPTQEYSLVDDTGNNIELLIDPISYIMTLALKNSKGVTLSKKTIDFPIESMVIGAAYESGDLILTLQNGQTLNVDISTIVSGLVKDSLTVAGIDMKDNITVEELTAALGLDNKADKENPTFTGAATFENIRVEKVLIDDSDKIGISYETREGSITNGVATEIVADMVFGNLDYGEASQWLPPLKFNGNMEVCGSVIGKNFEGIANNFTTDNENMAAAAPLVKQLYEENQSLKQQLNNKKFAYEKESYVSANSTLQLELSKGMYIITFGQGGAWDITGMAFAVMTDMQQSSVCYKVCGSAMFLEKMDIVLNASSKTINITNGNGANVTLRIYSI